VLGDDPAHSHSEQEAISLSQCFPKKAQPQDEGAVGPWQPPAATAATRRPLAISCQLRHEESRPVMSKRRAPSQRRQEPPSNVNDLPVDEIGGPGRPRTTAVPDQLGGIRPNGRPGLRARTQASKLLVFRLTAIHFSQDVPWPMPFDWMLCFAHSTAMDFGELFHSTPWLRCRPHGRTATPRTSANRC